MDSPVAFTWNLCNLSGSSEWMKPHKSLTTTCGSCCRAVAKVLRHHPLFGIFRCSVQPQVRLQFSGLSLKFYCTASMHSWQALIKDDKRKEEHRKKCRNNRSAINCVRICAATAASWEPDISKWLNLTQFMQQNFYVNERFFVIPSIEYWSARNSSENRK